MRSHFKGAQFKQAQAQPETFRGIELVDTELGAMRVSRDIDEQIAKQPIDHGRRAIRRAQITKSNIELVQGVQARLIDARRLARRSDIHAGKKIRERRVILPKY